MEPEKGKLSTLQSCPSCQSCLSIRTQTLNRIQTSAEGGIDLDRIYMIYKIWNLRKASHQPPNLVHLVNPVFLFITQTLNRIQTRRFARGPDAEDQSDGDTDGQSRSNSPGWNRGGQAGYQEHYEFADPDRRQHADDSAKKRQGHRFEQELISNVAAARAQRLANADFCRALSNAHQHDVHDPDAAHHQADR